MHRKSDKPSAGAARRDLLPGTLEMLILRTLSHDPAHGYAITKSLREASEDVLQVEEGSLYPALQRLEVKGWVTAEWRLSEKNRRARIYELTPAGREQLAREVEAFDRMVLAITRVLRTA
jgi:PadR family transcriptional regulator PadR